MARSAPVPAPRADSSGPVATHDEPLLRLEGLTKVFPLDVGGGLFRRRRRELRAVEDVSFDIQHGEILGLVGESGCGKSTLGKLAIRLVEPTSGRVYFEGRELTALGPTALRAMRRHMQIIFQDPLASLDPRMTVRQTLAEPLKLYGKASTRAQVTEAALDLLSQVGLGSDALDRYPHEFSGGQRQRICIARALAPSPSFIVADEPLSALDVSVQAQIVNLILDLQEQLGLGFLFISHDLNVIGLLATRVVVMYLGRVVEIAPPRALYEEPLHPYSRALLSLVPVFDPSRRESRPRQLLQGELPRAANPPGGCSFHPRCPLANERCRIEVPELRAVGSGRLVRCHEV